MDFDRLVIAPLMGIFGKPIIVTPTVSQPGMPSYVARGDFRISNIDMSLLGGGIESTQTIAIGLRKADFLVFVVPEDVITVDGVDYLVDDTDDDPQGHSIVTLKRVSNDD